tara:strand:+ start:273 stop:632 length:360 start_codon:yes stop_codon:yes gene_type:complete
LSTTVIKLQKLTFFGYHGVNQNEIQNGQDFILDLSLGYQRSNNSDDIENVINYIELYDLVKNSFQEKRFNLLESLGQKILDDIKTKYDSVFHIKLNIRKPSITVDNNKDFINIELEYTK